MSNAPPPDASPPNARTEPTPLPMPLSPPAASHELDAPVDQAEASNRLNDRDLGNLEASAAVVKADDASEAGYSMSVSASAVPTADAEPKEKKKKKKDKAKQGKEENGEKDKEKEFKPRFPNGKTVLLIRHGEKPPPEEDIWGNLTTDGYARADFVAHLFGHTHTNPTIPCKPPLTLPRPPLRHIYAPEPKNEKRQRRMRQTVEPLSKKTGIPIDTRFSVDDPESVAETIATEFPEDEQGTVLVCWEHKVLVEICEMLLSHDGREKAGKLKWPKEDFDSIWVVQDGELSFYKQGFDIEIWNSTAEERKKKRIEDLGIGRGGLIRRMTSWVVGEPIDEVRGEGKEERPVFEGAKKAERTDSGGSGGKGGGVSRTDSGSKEGKGDLAGPGGLGTPTRTDSGKARMPMPSSPPIGPSLPSSPPKAPLLTVSLPDTDAVATIHADMPVNLIPPVLDAVKDSIVTLGEPKTDDEGTDGEKKKAKKDKKKGKEVIPVDATGIAPTAEEPRPSVDLSPPRQSTESAPLLAVPGKPLKKKKKDKKKDKVKTLLRTDSVQVLGFDGRYGLYGEMDEREREKGDEVGEGFCCGLCSGCTIL